MFGDFYNNHIKIEILDYGKIENGTPIVRMSNYFPYYQFGIFYNGKVIQQTYIRQFGKTVYEEVGFKRFIAGDDVVLFEYTPVIFKYDKEKIVERAIQFLSSPAIDGVFSVFGDDFVFWCMVGEKFDSFFNGSKMGHHIEIPYREGIFKIHHHAIAIEQDVVIHFHDDESMKKTCICFSPYSELKDAKIIPHKDENLQNLMITRNRALLAWTGRAYDGKYSLVFNNCEHFVEWCKTGVRKSNQVRTALGDIVIGSFCLFVPEVWPIALLRFKKYLL